MGGFGKKRRRKLRNKNRRKKTKSDCPCLAYSGKHLTNHMKERLLERAPFASFNFSYEEIRLMKQRRDAIVMVNKGKIQKLMLKNIGFIVVIDKKKKKIITFWKE